MTRAGEVGHLVESVVAAHLRRAFGERVFFWRTADHRETDFVVDRPGSSQADETARPSLIEVKYQRAVDDRDVRTVAAHGGGLVVTRQAEGFLAGGAVYALPLCDLLVLLDTPALATARR